MDISSYIKDLLIVHDSVALPRIGTFKLVYRSSEITKTETGDNKLTPPTKRIAFDGEAIKDDNVLKNHIADVYELSPEKAAAKVEDAMKALRTKLAKGESIVFDEIGSLYYDAHDILRFDPEPDSILLNESFGLGTINLTELPPDEEKVPAFASETPEKKESKSLWRILLLILLPLIIILAFVGYKTDFFRDFSALAYNDHQTNAETVTEDNPAENIPAPLPPAEDKDTTENTAETTDNETDTESTEATPADTETAEEELQVVVEDNGSPTKKYYLVVGSFSKPENAQNLKQSMDNKGFEAQIFSADNYNRVTIGGYDTKDKVMDEFHRLRAQHQNMEVWIWVR